MVHRGTHEINARVQDSQRRQALMVAGLPSQRSYKESSLGLPLRQYLAHAVRELLARVEPRLGGERLQSRPH